MNYLKETRYFQKEEDLQDFATSINSLFRPGDGIALEGPLGVGKTTFVRYVLRSWGYEGPITSPTYTLMMMYELSNCKVVHVDGFRLEANQPMPWDWQEWNKDLVFVEWPENVGIPKSRYHYRIVLSFKDTNTRCLKLYGTACS